MQINLQQVSYQYPHGPMGLHQINLQIQQGEFLFITGANGSGKSTLCRVFNGLIPHVHAGTLQGRVDVLGYDTRQAGPTDLFQHVAWLGQRLDVFCFNRTVAQELAWNLQCLGLDRAIIEQRCFEASHQWHLSHLLHRDPQTLSSGERLRVALAAMLITRPQILVLDEPTATLDSAGQTLLITSLQQLHSSGTTIIVAEHQVQAFQNIATRMIILEHGQIIQDGDPTTMIDQHQAEWLSANTTPPTLLQGDQLIETHELSYCIAQRPILDVINVEVAQSELILVRGNNGAGKTTLLEILADQRQPSYGWCKRYGRVTLAIQQPERMLFTGSVLAELQIGPQTIKQLDHSWIEQIIDELGLRALLQRVPQQLSTGEQRRVALAALLAMKPAVLLLDEPTSYLDWHWRKQMYDLLHYCREQAMGIVVATHEQTWPHVSSTWMLEDTRLVANYAL